MKDLFLFTAALLLSGCSETPADTVIRVDVNADATREVVSRVSISKVIPLAGDVPVGEVHKTVLWNGRYYLFSKNDRAITCFDDQGDYVFRIAAQGRGPQEYLGPNNFFIDETDGELKVLSLDGDLVSFSPEDGSFIRRESSGSMMVNDAFAIDDKTTAFSVMGPDWNFEVRRDGGEPTFLLPFNELRDFRISRKLVSREGSNVFLCYGQDDNIYSLADGGGGRDTVRVAFSVDFGPKRIDPRIYSIASEEERVATLENRQAAGSFATVLDDLCVTRDHVSFSYWHFPSIEGEPSMPCVIFDRRTGTTYNFPHGGIYRQNDFYLLPAAGTLPDGSFFSVVHPVRILTEGESAIPDVTRAMKELAVAEDHNPVVIAWTIP